MRAAPLLCLVGPTAIGKTSLAIELARRFDAEIIGVDASQIYQGLDLGTGKATPAELGDVVHHLIDVVPPDAPFDAAAFAAHADAAIEAIRARGRRIILCGGTGLYLNALLFGLCAAPPGDPAIRAALQARLAAGEHAALHAELAAVDPAAAARIGPRDGQRIERALSVYQSTGRALSDWQAAQPTAARYPHRLIGLRCPRPALFERIERRLDAMLAAGFLAEVEGLLRAGYGPALRALSALGYRHLAAVHAGALPLAEARRQILVATRRYAKRQLTWFERQPGIRWFEAPVDPAEIAAYVARLWPPAGGATEVSSA